MARGAGHRALGRRAGRRRRGARRPTRLNRILQLDPVAPARRGRARRGQRAALRGGAPARPALRARSLEPERLHPGRQRRRERRRTALPQVRRHHQPRRRRSRSCCPTARAGAARLAAAASRGVPTSSGSSSAARGCSASPPRSPCGSSRSRRRVRTLLADFPTVRAASEAVCAIIAAGIVPGGAGDDGPGLRAGGGGVDLRRRLSDRRGGGAAGGARRQRGGGARRRPRWSRRCSGEHGAREVRSAATAGGAGAALAGPEEGVRRHGPDRARPGRAGRRGAADRAAGHPRPDRRDRRALRPQHQQRLPRRRRQPAPQHQLRPPRPGPRRTGCTPPAARSWHACVAAGGSITGEHGVGSDKLDYMPDLRRRDPRRDARGPAGLRSRRAGQPRQGRSRPRLPRVARGGGCAHESTSSSTGSARSSAPRRSSATPTAYPRAIPDSTDAVRRYVCRLARRSGLAGPGRGPGHLAAARRAGRSRAQHPRARPGRVGAARPTWSRPSRRACRWTRCGAGWPTTACGSPSIPPGRPERTLGSVVATATAGPLRARLRPGARPRARLHRRDRRRPGGQAPAARVVKNVAGYDLTKLQVGGFGGFGVITELHLRLRALPARRRHPARARHRAITSPARRATSPTAGRRARGARAALPRARGGVRLGPGRALRRHRRRRGRRSCARIASIPPTCRGSELAADRAAAFWHLVTARGSGAADHRSGSASSPTALDELDRPVATTSTKGSSRPARAQGGIRWTGEATPDQLRALRRARRRARDPDDAGARAVGGAAARSATSARTAKGVGRWSAQLRETFDPTGRAGRRDGGQRSRER